MFKTRLLLITCTTGLRLYNTYNQKFKTIVIANNNIIWCMNNILEMSSDH